MQYSSLLLKLVGWLFGAIVFAIGFVNTFWGNDAILGIGMLLLAFIYLPPVNNIITQKTSIKIPVIGKILLGLLLLWIALGVGELFGKIDMMLQDLK